MPDVVLINPAISQHIRKHKKLQDVRIREPLAVLCLGSYLADRGYRVKIIDVAPYYEAGDEYYFKILKKAMKNATCAGISVMTAQIANALRISKYIRENEPDLPIIWGGVHPTLFPSQTSKDHLIDFVVHGEGEETLLELVKALETGNKTDKIKGISYNGKVNPPRDNLDPNKLPFLNHELLDLRFYLERPVTPIFPSNKRFRKLTMLSSRGCPYRCVYCINRIYSPRWRAQAPDRFLDEMEFLIDKYKLEMIKPMDENFFVSKQRAEEIIKGMKERRIDIIWGANMRANYFNDNYVTKEFAKKLAATGFGFALIGSESGSDRVLRMLKKDITTKDILRSAKTCHESNIIPAYSWMIAIPGQAKKEMISNIKIIRKIQQICPTARHYDNFIFRPYPGGELYEECRKRGLYEPEYLEEWADANIETGYTDLNSLPWIKDKEFVNFLSVNARFLVHNLKNTYKYNPSYGTLFLAILAKLRWKLNFFGLQQEEEHFRDFARRHLSF